MDRNPTQYSRLLVFFGLLPLLFIDLFIGLPEGLFAAIGTLIIGTAAVIHSYCGEHRAGIGWVLFGGALLFVSRFDVAANILYLVVFALLLLSGFILLASQRLDPDAEETPNIEQ